MQNDEQQLHAMDKGINHCTFTFDSDISTMETVVKGVVSHGAVK